MAKPKSYKLAAEKSKELFLAELALSPNVSQACAKGQISRTTAYEWKKEDESFAKSWEELLEASTDLLEAEARRRAHKGVEEPVFWQGKVCGAIQKYSDTLLIFLLKAHRPEKYREAVVVASGGPGGSITLKMVTDEIPALPSK